MDTAYQLREHDTITGEAPYNYILRVRDLPYAARPREKLLASGVASLGVAELIAIVWGVGTRREDVLSMAHRVIQEYGERAIITETDPMRLSELLNIPLAKSCQIIACLELGRRHYSMHGHQPRHIRNAEHAYAYLKPMAQSPKEQLRGLYLNSRYQLIHEEIISIGSLTANIVHPREVFAPAITHGAVGIVLGHNHPSGDSTPTTEDRDVTHQLIAAGKLIGIDIIDHLVIVSDGYQTITPGR